MPSDQSGAFNKLLQLGSYFVYLPFFPPAPVHPCSHAAALPLPPAAAAAARRLLHALRCQCVGPWFITLNLLCCIDSQRSCFAEFWSTKLLAHPHLAALQQPSSGAGVVKAWATCVSGVQVKCIGALCGSFALIFPLLRPSLYPSTPPPPPPPPPPPFPSSSRRTPPCHPTTARCSRQVAAASATSCR